MRSKLSVTLVVPLLAVSAWAIIALRRDVARLPRVRVGPLVAERPAADRLVFFALGDTGTGGEAQYAVAQAMEARCRAIGGVAGVLLLGDNSYQAGFRSVDDPAWQTRVETPYGGDCLGAAPLYPVLGNHDYEGNPEAEIEYSLLNPRWHLPNRFYAVRFGALVKVVAFDSQLSEFCLRPSFCTGDFLLDETRAEPTAAAWNLVIAHHPLASSSARGGNHTGGLRGTLLSPLLCDRIDAWIAGHAHHLEHREPEGCRMQLFVAGGGGADLYPVADERPPEVRFAASQHGFLELEVERGRLTTRFFDAAGALLHASIRTKGDR